MEAGGDRSLARAVADQRGSSAFTESAAHDRVFTYDAEKYGTVDAEWAIDSGVLDSAKFGALEHEDGMTVAVCPVRPDSRGTIMARSSDASEKPIITPNYLSDAADVRGFVLFTGPLRSGSSRWGRRTPSRRRARTWRA